jgi:hypothetical protein
MKHDLSNPFVIGIAASTVIVTGCASKCEETQARSTTGECVDVGQVDPNDQCKQDYNLTGEIEFTTLDFTTFAWAELNNGTVLILGFPDDRENETDACSLIEQHVTGTFWWHDGAIVELRIRGEWSEGGQVEINDNSTPSDSAITMNVATSVMDEWNDLALGGSAQLAPVSIGESIDLSDIQTISSTGGLSSSVTKACYCPSVVEFWGVVPPEETGDTDSDEL